MLFENVVRAPVPLDLNPFVLTIISGCHKENARKSCLVYLRVARLFFIIRLSCNYHSRDYVITQKKKTSIDIRI